MEKINITPFLYVAIGILSYLLLTNSCCRDVVVDETTTIKTETVTEIDSSSNQEIKNQVPEQVSIVEHKDSISIIPKEEVHKQDPEKVKQVNRYRDTTYFENAVVYSDILSEGRLLKIDLKTSIDHLRTTITKTKTVIRSPGTFYVHPKIQFTPGLVSQAGTNVLFIKGNFGASAGVAYSFINPKTPFLFELGVIIKL
tara:strand:+ start:221 stop:814 length:594 start_codon:yes stop_codon:yes gene_type:complete